MIKGAIYGAPTGEIMERVVGAEYMPPVARASSMDAGVVKYCFLEIPRLFFRRGFGLRGFPTAISGRAFRVVGFDLPAA